MTGMKCANPGECRHKKIIDGEIDCTTAAQCEFKRQPYAGKDEQLLEHETFPIAFGHGNRWSPKIHD